MRTVTELVPLAIGVAVLGGITWFMLDRHWAVGPWLLAALLFAHGWVHMMFVFPQPEPTAGGPLWPFDLSGSWLIASVGIEASIVRAVGVAMMVITVGGFVLAALATVAIVVPTSWWTALFVGSSVTSLVLLGVAFSPTLLLGIAIDLALIWFAVSSAWTPATRGIGAIG